MQITYKNAAGELITVGEPSGHRKPKVKRDVDDKEKEKTWTEFRYCKTKCCACNSCGWFWGPGHEKFAGKPAVFGIYPLTNAR